MASHHEYQTIDFYGHKLFLFRSYYVSLREIHSFLTTNFLAKDTQSWRSFIRTELIGLSNGSQFNLLYASRGEIKLLKAHKKIGMRAPKILLIHIVMAHKLIQKLIEKKGYVWIRRSLKKSENETKESVPTTTIPQIAVSNTNPVSNTEQLKQIVHSLSTTTYEHTFIL
jgi:hypothetical protein